MSKSIRRKKLKYKYWCKRHSEKVRKEIKRQIRALIFWSIYEEVTGEKLS